MVVGRASISTSELGILLKGPHQSAGSASSGSEFPRISIGLLSYTPLPLLTLRLVTLRFTSRSSLRFSSVNIAMFYVIGLGLCDEKDITVRGLEVCPYPHLLHLKPSYPP